MTRHRTALWMPIGIVVMLAVTVPAGAQQPASAQQPTSELRIRELVRLAAQRIATGQQPDDTKSPQDAGTPALPPDNRPTVSLSLDDVVKLTLDRNLTIAVQRLNPPQFDPAIAALRTSYLPQATSLLATQSVGNPPTAGTQGIPAGATSVTSGVTTFNGGLTQNAPWWGGQFAAVVNNLKQTTTSTAALYNPVYLPTYTVSYTQPLLRGRAIDPNRQQILVTRIARDIGDVQLKSTIINTVSSAREAYWTYLYTVQAVDVAQQALGLASQLVSDNRVRLQVGTATPIDVVTARSQEAAAYLTVVQAIGTRDTAEVALKQLIVSGTQDPNWNARIIPADRPDFEPVQVNIQDAVRRALAERTDLDMARKNVQQNDITYKFVRNQLLPQADLVATWGLQGLGGTQLVRAAGENEINSEVVSTLPGGFGNALSSLFNNDYPTWSVQLRFSTPIGHTTVATTTMAAAKLEMEQASMQVRQIELQVATDVTNAAISIRNDIQAVQSAQVAQDLAQQSYDAERTKLEVGLSTNYNVIQQLNLLNTAKSNYLQSVLNYRNALVELDRLQQTTLTTANVTLLGGAAWGNGAQAVGNLTGAPVGSAR
jgi:outer membrane protein